MQTGAQRAWEFIERCYAHAKSQALFDDFAEVVATFGFEHFIISGLPAHGENVEDLVICNRWPDAWTDRYRSQAYFAADPVSQLAFSRATPFSWRLARSQFPSTKTTSTIEAEAKDFGLVDGVGFPVADPENWQAVASLASNLPCDLAATDMSLVYLVLLSYQMRLADIRTRPREPLPQLTPREIEVLNWIAAGKSYWDISVILNIAEATVQSHLASARRKLDAVNSVQAVARAARNRQIRI